jgi:integrase
MTFLLGTGCRIGEALGMTWQDIDFEKAEFYGVENNGQIDQYETDQER